MILIEYPILLVVRILVGLMYVLPHAAALWIARGVVCIIRCCMYRSTRVCLRNLEFVFPDMDLSQRKKLVSGFYETLAQNLVNYAKIPLLAKIDVDTVIDAKRVAAELQHARSVNPSKGVLYVTAHMGNFELCVQACSLVDLPTSILARGFGLPRVDAWWNKRREMFGCRVFERRGGFAQIVDNLNSGKNACVLFDQNVKRNHAVFVDFFGIPAATTKSVALAAIRTGATICFLTSYSDEHRPCNVFLRTLPPAESFGSTTEEQIHGITSALHAALEEVIRIAPEQWFWMHRRFKTRPENEAEDLYQGC